MLDVIELQKDLIRVNHRSAAIFSAVIREDVFDVKLLGLIEGQSPGRKEHPPQSLAASRYRASQRQRIRKYPPRPEDKYGRCPFKVPTMKVSWQSRYPGYGLSTWRSRKQGLAFSRRPNLFLRQIDILAVLSLPPCEAIVCTGFPYSSLIQRFRTVLGDTFTFLPDAKLVRNLHGTPGRMFDRNRAITFSPKLAGRLHRENVFGIGGRSIRPSNPRSWKGPLVLVKLAPGYPVVPAGFRYVPDSLG